MTTFTSLNYILYSIVQATMLCGRIRNTYSSTIRDLSRKGKNRKSSKCKDGTENFITGNTARRTDMRATPSAVPSIVNSQQERRLRRCKYQLRLWWKVTLAKVSWICLLIMVPRVKGQASVFQKFQSSFKKERIALSVNYASKIVQKYCPILMGRTLIKKSSISMPTMEQANISTILTTYIHLGS